MKPYYMLEVDKKNNAQIIEYIQKIYFRHASPKESFEYSQKLNKFPTKEMLLIELVQNFDDLAIITENENLQNVIANSI